MSADGIRQAGVTQVPRVYSRWRIEHGREVLGLKEWDLFTSAVFLAPAHSAAVDVAAKAYSCLPDARSTRL
eukprot:9276229-Lingulodinium_polyedra.AAC.1